MTDGNEETSMKVVEFNPKAKKPMIDAAGWLRDIADRCENGDVSEIVVVLQDAEGSYFESNVEFTDRWRMLGALEYARAAVHER